MLGARLGHVLFYQSDLILKDPLSILLPIRTQGGFEFTGFQGLASHGAAIGIILGMYLYRRKYHYKSLMWILDRIVIPVASGAVFIRLGNFINSEIIGKETDSIFGVRFIQNYYEAFCYVFVFLILYLIYKKTNKGEQSGFLFGLFLVLLWTVRFFVEFVKEPQGDEYINWFNLNTGQWLSIPFIIIGLYFMFLFKPKNTVSN